VFEIADISNLNEDLFNLFNVKSAESFFDSEKQESDSLLNQLFDLRSASE